MIYQALVLYCESINVEVQFVPTGTELIPPSITVDQLDFDPALDRKVDHLNSLFFKEEENEENDGGGGGGIVVEEEEDSWA
eukprot:12868046-Ditylum_brightwellii.AAC.1